MKRWCQRYLQADFRQQKLPKPWVCREVFSQAAVPSAPSLALAFPSPSLWGPLHAAAKSPRAEKVILGGGN